MYEPLVRISKELTGWRVLCPYFGLSPAQQEAIEDDYKRTEEQRYHVLVQWQKNNPRATFKDLADVFDKAGRQDLVDLTLKVANGRVYVPRLSSKPKLSCPRTRLCVSVCLSLVTAVLALLCGFWLFKVNETSITKQFETFTSSRRGVNNLRSFNSLFVGRSQNVSQITDLLLTNPSVRGVHITGPPAIGKTRLATEVGWKLVEHGIDVHYIHVTEEWLWVQPNKPVASNKPISSSEQNTTALLLSGISDLIAFGWSRIFAQERIKNVFPAAVDLINSVKDMKYPTVVILDNCDDILEGHLQDDLFKLIQELQIVSNGLVKTISASRVHFTPTNVRHFPLGALDVSSSISLLQQECDKIKEEEAVTVAGLVGCNPLGVKLAASLACARPSVQALISELADDSIKTLSCESIPNEEKMELLIKKSVDQLGIETQLCARNISLFPRSINQKAGKIILHRLGVKDVTICLNSLFYRSLLEWYHMDQESWYTYHQLIKDFLKPMSYDFYYKGDSGFCVHFVEYYTQCVIEMLQDCGLEMTKFCKIWFKNEDQNIRHVLEALSFCPSWKSLNIVLRWRKILTNPVFWEFYDEETTTALIHKGLVLILKLNDNPSLEVMKLHEKEINLTFNTLANQAIEWNRVHFTYLRQLKDEWSFRPVMVREKINLCTLECQIYCTDTENGFHATIFFHLCRLGCDKDCCYHITEVTILALSASLLLPVIFKIFGHRTGKTQYKVLKSTGLHLLLYGVGITASNTPASYLTMLVHSCITFILPFLNTRVTLTGDSDSQYLYITLLKLLMMLACAFVSLGFGGRKSLIVYLVSLPLLSYLSDSISVPLFIRILVVLCVLIVSRRSVKLLLQWPFNIIILLVVVGQEQLLMSCPYIYDPGIRGDKSCSHRAILFKYTSS